MNTYNRTFLRFAASLAISLSVCSFSSSAVSQTVEGDQPGGSTRVIDIERELKIAEQYFRWKPDIVLVLAQALMGVLPDGVWGDKTETALANLLTNYLLMANNGSGDVIRKPSDTEDFLDWLAKTQYATVTGRN